MLPCLDLSEWSFPALSTTSCLTAWMVHPLLRTIWIAGRRLLPPLLALHPPQSGQGASPRHARRLRLVELSAISGIGPRPRLDRWSKTLDCFASSTDYAAFVLQGLQQDLADPFDEAIGGLFFGSDAFAAQLRPLVRTPHLIEDIPQTRALNAVAAPSLEAIRSAVMDTFSGLSDCQRQRMFVYALRRFSHATGREIASVTGRSPSAVTHVWRELQDRLTVDMTFKQQVEALARILGTETPKLS